jgi:hypothetical protein
VSKNRECVVLLFMEILLERICQQVRRARSARTGLSGESKAFH